MTRADDAVAHFASHRDELLADLIALCRIPGISAGEREPVRQSAEATAELLRKHRLENVRILEIDGAHPSVYADFLRNPAAPTLLLYAHHDVQPVGDRARWTSDPFDPVERDGRLYARGSSDDKAGVLAFIAAAASWIETAGELPCNVKFFIEGEEEIGSPNLGKFLEKYGDLLAADCVILADSPNFDTGIPAITYRLRGMCQVDVEVRCLERPLHSGRGGGVVPDAVAILCALLTSLEIDDENVAAIDDRERSGLASLNIDAERFRRDAGLLDGVELLANDAIPERLWTQPSMTIIAFEARPMSGSFNQILDSARARISIRTVPDLDSRETGEALVRKLTASPPANARVTAHVRSHAPWWRTETTGPAYDAARRALARGYGRDPVMQGSGGTISFVRTFADAFGNVPLILLGVEDPPCNAHSEDESLHLGDWERCTKSAIYLYEELASVTGGQ